MMIALKTYSKRATPTATTLNITERLPAWVVPPCQLDCSFLITSISDYYLLKFDIKGHLSITCQRCLEQDGFEYAHSAEIAICHTESRADALMSLYDTIVVEGEFVDLEAVIVDELHLSLPHMPHDEAACQANLRTL